MNTKKIYAVFLLVGLITYAGGGFFLSTIKKDIFLSPAKSETTSLINYLVSPFVLLIFSGIVLAGIFLSSKKNKNFLERIHQGRKNYKRKKIFGVRERKFRMSTDNVIYLLAFLGPLFSLPQILEALFGAEISGTALFSWSSYLVIGFAWFVYGLIHKYKPIMIAYSIWIILEIIVIVKVITGS